MHCAMQHAVFYGEESFNPLLNLKLEGGRPPIFGCLVAAYAIYLQPSETWMSAMLR
jgi:hypothetical protein